MTETTNAVPNPGSDEAVARGCTCPVIDNAHGRGFRGSPWQFVMVAGCPLHMPLPDDDGQPDEMTEWRDFDADC